MGNKPNDILFQLIKSLEKSEKRHFKLFITRSSANEDLKIIRVFDIIDKLEIYDERIVLKKLKEITKPQLANLKAHLYREILASLRLLKSTDSLDLQISDTIDQALILYKKGLFFQSVRMLDKAKVLADEFQKYYYLPQIINLEKRIQSLSVSYKFSKKIETLSEEATQISYRFSIITRLSNLASEMYSFYITNGHARNEGEEKKVTKYFKANLPSGSQELKGFYEQLYYYQSATWYTFIKQDFLSYYKYVNKWLRLFDEHEIMKRSETGLYIKALHNLLNANFYLRNYKKFEGDLKRFETFAATKRVQNSENFKIQSFVYIASAKINYYSITGKFKEGLKIVPSVLKELKQYEAYIDDNRLMVINYKIAILYFGSGDYSTSIDYLQKIIYHTSDLRPDIQCYARLTHLIAHYEMGNLDLMDSLTRSVYRYMSKIENYTVIESTILKFLKNSSKYNRKELLPLLENFLEETKHLEGNRYETRSFSYLDIISWLESKLQGKTMGEVIYQKYEESKHK